VPDPEVEPERAQGPEVGRVPDPEVEPERVPDPAVDPEPARGPDPEVEPGRGPRPEYEPEPAPGAEVTSGDDVEATATGEVDLPDDRPDLPDAEGDAGVADAHIAEGDAGVADARIDDDATEDDASDDVAVAGGHRSDDHDSGHRGSVDDEGFDRIVVDPQRYRERWDEVQVGFVDEPRRSVSDADVLVADVIDEITKGFAATRADLEDQWSGGGDASTEDLRVALQRYRAFFRRLLST
jgi:hypothetical protein